MNMRKILKLFDSGNVCVVGLRGCGKDMLFANVIARRKQPYISNTDYHCKKSPFMKLSFDRLNIKNNYKNFISGEIVPMITPTPKNAIFISAIAVFICRRNTVTS